MPRKGRSFALAAKCCFPEMTPHKVARVRARPNSKLPLKIKRIQKIGRLTRPCALLAATALPPARPPRRERWKDWSKMIVLVRARLMPRLRALHSGVKSMISVRARPVRRWTRKASTSTSKVRPSRWAARSSASRTQPAAVPVRRRILARANACALQSQSKRAGR